MFGREKTNRKFSEEHKKGARSNELCICLRTFCFTIPKQERHNSWRRAKRANHIKCARRISYDPNECLLKCNFVIFFIFNERKMILCCCCFFLVLLFSVRKENLCILFHFVISKQKLCALPKIEMLLSVS